MSEFPPHIYDQFFEPLVATPEHQWGLAIRLLPSSGRPGRMYRQLRGNLEDELRGAADTLPLDGKDRRYIASNSTTLAPLAVAALECVGDMHTTHAKGIPGHVAARGIVGRNTDVALGRVLGIANSSPNAAALTIISDHFGQDPYDKRWKHPAMTAFRLAAKIRPTERWAMSKVSPGAYIQTIDKQGQLHIRPRYPKAKEDNDLRCPAAAARINTGEAGHKPNAMFTVMRIVGDVAMRHIYPRQFRMVYEPPEPHPQA